MASLVLACAVSLFWPILLTHHRFVECRVRVCAFVVELYSNLAMSWSPAKKKGTPQAPHQRGSTTKKAPILVHSKLLLSISNFGTVLFLLFFGIKRKIGLHFYSVDRSIRGESGRFVVGTVWWSAKKTKLIQGFTLRFTGGNQNKSFTGSRHIAAAVINDPLLIDLCKFAQLQRHKMGTILV